jgi:hypothetical protein
MQTGTWTGDNRTREEKKTEEEKKLVIGVVEPPKALGRRLPLLGREHGARSKSIGS